jgi:Zn-dependent metalloprotease
MAKKNNSPKKPSRPRTTRPRPAKPDAEAARSASSPAGVQGRPKFVNGLRTFALHAEEGPGGGISSGSFFAAAAAIPSAPLADMSAETAALHYLQQSLASEAVPQFTAAEVSGTPAEFKCLGVETVPLTDTQIVKFRQYYRKIPVYGTLVTVELDKKNNLVSINSSLGDPVNVDHIARISPLQVMETIRQTAGYGAQPLDMVPRLVYYFDPAASRWRLAYLTEDVLKRLPEEAKSVHGLPQLVDYVIDAHTGEIVAELPRTQTAAEDVEETGVLDELDKPRAFFCLQDGTAKSLHDRNHNVHTHDFQFRDIELEEQALPGGYVPNPPSPWHRGAVSAHANAVQVARFVREVLRRNGLNNQGEALVSSVNCRYWRHGTDVSGKEWRNAAWIGKQMVYGQKKVGSRLRSYAAALDVVAHEICHGLTDRTARLQYLGMSGALNESYSDIFGIIISNFQEPNLKKWNWEMGEELEETGIPIRDFSNPPRFNQPDHMDRYVQTNQDNGGVHINSGIHNKAAYNLLTAKSAGGGTLFDAKLVIQLFYLALSQHLSRTSGFSDSRRGVVLAARSLFRQDPQRDARLAAIGEAFDKVGIG